MLSATVIFSPSKGRGVNWLHFAIQVQTISLISDILGTMALSAKISEIKDVG